MLKAIAIAVLICVALAGVACSNNKDSRNSNDKAAFMHGAENRIDDLKAQLARLKDDIATGQANDEAQQQADALGRRIDDAQSKLDDIRASSGDQWQNLRGSLDQSLSDAGDLVDQIGGELGID